jgi:competence protein ComEA
MFGILSSTLALICMTGLVAAAQSAATSQAKAPARAQRAASTQVVNINTASASEFEALPGIGPKMANRIVEYRQKNGPFKKVEELMNVRGLGEKNFLKLKAQLTVGTAKPAERAQP